MNEEIDAWEQIPPELLIQPKKPILKGPEKKGTLTSNDCLEESKNFDC